MNEELSKLLNTLKEKPGMYFGKKSLSKLIECVNGYILCMNERDGVIHKFLPYFQEFIEAHYDLGKNKYVFRHWAEIIIFFNPTEKEAFEEFYKLVNEYLKLDMKQLEELSAKNANEKIDIE